MKLANINLSPRKLRGRRFVFNHRARTMSLVIDFVRLCLTMRWFNLQDNLVHIVVMIHSVS